MPDFGRCFYRADSLGSYSVSGVHVLLNFMPQLRADQADQKKCPALLEAELS